LIWFFDLVRIWFYQCFLSHPQSLSSALSEGVASGLSLKLISESAVLLLSAQV
jgi:hypothetical protein